MADKLNIRRHDHIESDVVAPQDLHADVTVWTAAQYRRAVKEAQALEESAENTPGFRRRQQLLADIFHYEQHFDRPDYNRAQPAKDRGKG